MQEREGATRQPSNTDDTGLRGLGETIAADDSRQLCALGSTIGCCRGVMQLWA